MVDFHPGAHYFLMVSKQDRTEWSGCALKAQIYRINLTLADVQAADAEVKANTPESEKAYLAFLYSHAKLMASSPTNALRGTAVVSWTAPDADSK